MARSIKSRGLSELRSLRARVLRQHALERISRPDRDWLITHIDELEARIIQMQERNEQGEEEG